MRTTLSSLALCALLVGCTPGENRAPAGDRDVAAAPAEEAAAAPDSDAVEVPDRYRGDWAADAAACDRPGDVSRLHIDDDAIRFHESAGPIVSVDDRDRTLAVTARLTGEGETREASYAFTLSPDGNTLTDAGGYARQRCD